MRCEQVRRNLPEYAVGGLSRWQRSRVRRHSEVCPPCRAELSALARTGVLVADTALESAPEGTWEAIRGEITSPARRQVQGWPRLRLAAVGALALLLLVAGGLSLRSLSTPPTPPVARVAAMARDSRAAEEGHLSAAWSAPLADTAAVGLGLEADEDES